MKLISLNIHGFKRFAGKEKISLDGKLVSIVGPNEAGKTSILSLLQHFNHDEPFRTSGPSQETSRGRKYPANHVVAKATYLVEDSDRDAVSHIPGSSAIRWLTVSKSASKTTGRIEVSPRPSRDVRPRQDAAAAIRSRLADVKQLLATKNRKNNEPAVRLDDVLAALDGDEPTLSKEMIASLQSLADIMRQAPNGESEGNLAVVIEKVCAAVTHEQDEHPEQQVKEALRKRLPRFLLFSDEDRLLQSSYELRQYFQEKRNRPAVPKALKNLASACELDLASLVAAREESDEGKIHTLIRNANRKLDELLEAWSQSGVTVQLSLNQHTLYILVQSGAGEYVQLAERSDGLRQFVALLIFISQQTHSVSPPVLLVDEAESHLHYDAQADLMQMLVRQTLAAKVVYTTHSIGCLPEDMGNVRLIQPEPSADYSKVINWFWDTDVPGFSPLLFGMGASTLAFIPVRYAVITEGASDFLLLPAMFKEVLSSEHLGFQVVPGTAHATSEQIAIVNSESPRTVYLVDGDEGGRNIAKKIREAGVPDDKILTWPQVNGSGAVIEDFLDSASYLRAVNEEISRSHGTSRLLTESDLGDVNRPAAVEKWCSERKMNEPSKRAVAYRLIENQYEHPLVASSSQSVLVDLHKQISDAIGVGSLALLTNAKVVDGG